MRIAFLTPEFITDQPTAGGLGNYLHRMTQLLAAAGHEVEVFVSSDLEPATVMHKGVRVVRVPFKRHLLTKVALRILRPLCLDVPLFFYLRSRSLSRALDEREREAPFQLVQSTDYLAVGMTVKSKPWRVHVVRCSCAMDLYNQADQARDPGAQWRERLERVAIRKGDIAYAPSSLVAEHFRRRHGIKVDTIRPPVFIEANPANQLSVPLPDRFLFHFGQLIERKGTFWLARALKIAFHQEPDIQVVLAGTGDSHVLEQEFQELGEHRSKVHLLGPLSKPELYAVLKRADAAVLPSLVDNLPNTVIESLMFGIPVIGTRGASINELVQEGVTGELVEPNDSEALAQAIVRTWRGESRFRKGFTWKGGIADEMEPANAINNFIRLAKD